MFLGKRARKTFDRIVERLGENDHIKINNDENFMPLYVERRRSIQHGEEISLAHYYKQNGDLVSDPYMVFIIYKNSNEVSPMFMEQGGHLFSQGIIEKEGRLFADPKRVRDMISFSNMWLKNLKFQQNI